MSYTTYAEILAMTGTTLPQVTVESLITLSDLEIDAYCTRAGVSASSTDPAIRTAGVNLAIVNVLTRMRMDGTKESSTLEYSDRTPIDSAIQTYRKTAYDALDQYVHSGSSRFVCEIANL